MRTFHAIVRPVVSSVIASVIAVVAVVAAAPSSRADSIDTGGSHALTAGWPANKCLDTAGGTRVLLLDCDGSAAQRWKLTALRGGFYRIASEGSGKCLDIANDGKNKDKPVLADCSNVTGQHWKLTAGKDDTFALTTEWRGDTNCLDVVNDGKANNKPILAACGKVSGQRWKLAGGDRAIADRGPARGRVSEPATDVPSGAATEPAGPRLTPAQSAASAKFQAALRGPMKALSAQCHREITLVTDFENFKQPTLDPKISKDCVKVLQSVRGCKGLSIKRVACVFAGYRRGRTVEEELKFNMALDEDTLTWRLDQKPNEPTYVEVPRERDPEAEADREREREERRTGREQRASEPKLKTLGQMCESNSECKSGKCKPVTSKRSTCN